MFKEPVVREEKEKLLQKFQEATRLAEEVKKLKAELDSKSGIGTVVTLE